MVAGSASITGLILAGGAGRRMGGIDKGLADYRGRPLVTHVLERLQPQVGCLLISANRNLDTYAALGHPVLPDPPGMPADAYPGPLAGLAAGLAVCRTPWLLCVPCDCPNLPLDLARRLLQSAEHSAALIAVARTTDGLQPTFLLCRHDLQPTLGAYLASGRRKVGDWCRELGAAEVDFDDASAFVNINNIHELNTLT